MKKKNDSKKIAGLTKRNKLLSQYLATIKLTNLLPVGLFVILLFLLILTFQVMTASKFYPFTYVGDTNISLLTPGVAIKKLATSFTARANAKLQFKFQEKDYQIDLATASATLDYSQISQDFLNQRAGSFVQRLYSQFKTLILGREISPGIKLSLQNQLDQINLQIKKNPQQARLVFNETETPEGSSAANIQITPGMNGEKLDQETLVENIKQYLLTGQYINQLPTKTDHPKITTEHVERAKEALLQIQKQPLKLTFGEKSYVIDAKQLLALLDLEEGLGLLDKDKTYTYINKLSLEIDRDVQEGLFEFNIQTKRVTAFKPSEQGQKLDVDKTYQLITPALSSEASEAISLPVAIVRPKIETSDVNSLGIKELIGRGISHFAGSIPNRIYNINLTAAKINGVLVPPGEVFSFNNTVGDITAQTGFKQAYVIKEGRTVLDDGGGVCQDSTTLFRAVLNAGLPVVKRTAHAYRVGYYEQGFPPGLDATVFYPSVDFQFKNDTQHHILIQAYTVGTTLYVDLYGTSDDRIATISRSIVTDSTPPPPELRQDDPTLPKGTVKQVDWAAWGAKVSFSRTVRRGGEEIIKETWKSNYKSWQAVYLVGTQ